MYWMLQNVQITVILKAEHVSGAENGVERAENRGSGAERGAWSARCRKTMELSGVRNGRSRSGNGAGSGLNRPRTTRSSLTIH